MRGRMVVAALAAASVVLSGCSFSLYGRSLPGGTDVGDDPMTITAFFTNVRDLVPQANVKVNDVAVGRVQSIALSKKGDPSGSPATNGWTAKVKLLVRSDVKLPSNARARIEQTTLLGEKYVQLAEPFDRPAGDRLHDGSVIPLVRTGTAPEVEEVLGALSLVLNGGGIQQIHTIATELNNALDGHEDEIRSLLTRLQTFTGTLNAQKDKIIDALVSLDNLSQTLNRQSDLLVTTLNTMPRALSILADQRRQLVGLLEGLSKLGVVATDVLDKTQAQLVRSLRSINPVLTTLSSVGDTIPKALKILGTFPFPVGVSRQFVRGDYANLHLFLNLNLKDELCALGILTGKACAAASTNSTRATRLTAEDRQAVSGMPPLLIGAGR